MKLKRTAGDKIFDFFNIVFLILFSALILYPVLYVVSRSFMPDAERAIRPLALIPHQWTLEGYTFILSSTSVLLSGFKITIFRTIVGTCVSLVLECMFAYALAQKGYPLKNIMTIMIAFTMWFNGGMIPTFLVVKTLGFQNSVWAYVIPEAMRAWYILIMRNFFAQIPESLPESAKIDGENEAGILFKIILPLSTPVLATIGLFHIVEHWNEWFSAVLYVTDIKKHPAMVILRQLLAQANLAEITLDEYTQRDGPSPYIVQMAAIVVIVFPVLVAYPFLQKYFTKGMLVGSVKG